MADDGALTALERGDTHPAIRGVARVVMVVAVVLVIVWSAPVNTWIKAVAERDKVIANPPEEGWLAPGQVQPWQANSRRR